MTTENTAFALLLMIRPLTSRIDKWEGVYMKKICLFILAICTVFLTACSQKNDESPTEFYPEEAEITAEIENSECITEEKTYSLGDTIRTDSVEITLHDCSFQDYVKTGGGSKMYGSDDNILACLSFTFKNNSDAEQRVSSFMDVELDYDNGFRFNTRDLPTLLFDEDRDYFIFYFDGAGRGTGVKVDVQPHKYGEYLLGIQCHKALAKDTTSPLTITFTLPDNGQSVKYTYVIR